MWYELNVTPVSVSRRWRWRGGRGRWWRWRRGRWIGWRGWRRGRWWGGRFQTHALNLLLNDGLRVDCEGPKGRPGKVIAHHLCLRATHIILSIKKEVWFILQLSKKTLGCQNHQRLPLGSLQEDQGCSEGWLHIAFKQKRSNHYPQALQVRPTGIKSLRVLHVVSKAPRQILEASCACCCERVHSLKHLK